MLRRYSTVRDIQAQAQRDAEAIIASVQACQLCFRAYYPAKYVIPTIVGCHTVASAAQAVSGADQQTDKGT
jgi:hypothetical protein